GGRGARPEHDGTPSEGDAKHLALAGAEAEPLVRHVERAVGADRDPGREGEARYDRLGSGTAPEAHDGAGAWVGTAGRRAHLERVQHAVSPGQPEHLLEPACPNSQVSRLRQTVDVL